MMLQFPEISNSAVIFVDMQERLVPVIKDAQSIIARQKIVLETAADLKIDTFVSEQYPKGLGHTVPELKAIFAPSWPIVEKTCFSCFHSPEFREKISVSPKKFLVIMGVETHVCILQTAMDAMAKGYQAIVLEDTVSSRSESNRQTALSFMRDNGVQIMNSEIFLFMLLRDAKHPYFKSMQQKVK